MIDSSQESRSDARTERRVKYAFAPTVDTTREGTAYLVGSDLKKICEPAAVATVLVDPANEKCFELYAVAAKPYRVVAE
jgi:hypothetical protein